MKRKTTTLISILFQTILNKNETFFIDISIDFIRSLRKCTENLKAIGLLEKKLCYYKEWIEMRYPICRSVRQEGGLRPTTVNNLKTRIWTFKDCLKLFKVFQVFHPLLSPILPYPYLFTRWPHRLVCSTHVNTMLLTVASLRKQQSFCFH